MDIPVAGRGDEIEKRVDTVVSEAGITLDTRLFRQDVIVLALEISDNLGEARLVVYLITETGSIDDGQRYAGALLIELEFCRVSSQYLYRGLHLWICRSAPLTDGDGLDPDTLLEMCVGGIIGVLSAEDLLAAECVDKGGTTYDMIRQNNPFPL
jgi:hypothetical protein